MKTAIQTARRLLPGPVFFAMLAVAPLSAQEQPADAGAAQNLDLTAPAEIDTDLITNSVMKESEILSYCFNVADAATETRNAILTERLAAIEKRVDGKLGKLAERIDELRKWTERRERFLKSGNAALVKIFQSMKPDAAALQLTELGPVTAAAIIIKLEPKVSSAILTEMKPAEAAKVATVLTSAIEADARNTQ